MKIEDKVENKEGWKIDDKKWLGSLEEDEIWR